MATSGDIVSFHQVELQIPAGTTHLCISNLRKDDILPPSKSGKGAAAFSTSNAVDVMLGVAVAQSNTKAAATVRAVRSAALTTPYKNALDPLLPPDDMARAAFAYVAQFVEPRRCLSAGDMIDGIVDAMRSGAFAKWACDFRTDVAVEFFDGGERVQIFINQPQLRESVVFSFNDHPVQDRAADRIFRIYGRVLKNLAETLGPLPMEAAP